jgi:hypothetical protein
MKTVVGDFKVKVEKSPMEGTAFTTIQMIMENERYIFHGEGIWL